MFKNSFAVSSAYHREYGLRVGIESWEREGSVIEVQGYKWLGKPRKIQYTKGGREVLDS